MQSNNIILTDLLHRDEDAFVLQSIGIPPHDNNMLFCLMVILSQHGNTGTFIRVFINCLQTSKGDCFSVYVKRKNIHAHMSLMTKEVPHPGVQPPG